MKCAVKTHDLQYWMTICSFACKVGNAVVFIVDVASITQQVFGVCTYDVLYTIVDDYLQLCLQSWTIYLKKKNFFFQQGR